MKATIRGFTLIELMIVLSVIGVLASIAVPSYQEYVARSRISESLFLTAGLKMEVASEVQDLASLAALATSWNAQAGGVGATSKFVNSVLIDATTGEITVTLNSVTIGPIPANRTLVFTPYRLIDGGTFAQLATAVNAVNAPNRRLTTWGCSSRTNTVAISKGLGAVVNGSLDPEFAPSECR